MENNPRPTLHPLLAIAAAAVILFAGVGTAHFLGWLPGKSETPAATTENVPAPAAASATGGTAEPPAAAVTQAPPVAPAAPAVQAAAKPAPKVAPKPVTHAKPAGSGTAPTAATPAATPTTAASATLPPPPVSAPCQDCGSIESVRQVTKEGQGSGIGAVAGGVLGGALGHGVGQGTGRDLATIAGAVGGAVLGNKIEKSQKTTSQWETTVRFEDGTTRVIRSDAPPAWRAGDRVKVVNGAIVPR